jgi:glycosyltransferase involved in cell wall biosynthesis
VNAALLFEPDGYLLTGPALMGRQAAGNGFLRAAVQAAGGETLFAYTAHRSSADVFRKTVAEIDPTVATDWIPGARLDLLARQGVLYRPDQALWSHARHRLRRGPAAYSLCGVTHTLATGGTLDVLGRMLTEPLMPWDALVCTSAAALAVVRGVLDHQGDYLRWRTGHAAPAEQLLLPVIPLGVHCADFAFSEADRHAARAALGLRPDDVAALFAGRLSVSGKTHPYAMFRALQQTARETGKPVVLVMAGQAHTPAMSALFNSSLATVCPDVRPVFVNGKDAAAYRGAWAGADLFISLADSVQETFGITPLEAMAAGLPAVVSDWNGYKDTVRDGVDGFRIATWAPQPGAGGAIATAFETGALTYDQYLSRSNTAVAVDTGELAHRLKDLVTDPELRRRMGAAGQARAREVFDWAVVFRAYQALWDEQTTIRRKAAEDPKAAAWLAAAPRTGSDHMGPFDTFASYPTHHVTAATVVRVAPGFTKAAYRELVAQDINALWKVAPEAVDRILDALASGPTRVGDLAAALDIEPFMTTEIVARLAKIDVVGLAAG